MIWMINPPSDDSDMDDVPQRDLPASNNAQLESSAGVDWDESDVEIPQNIVDYPHRKSLGL